MGHRPRPIAAKRFIWDEVPRDEFEQWGESEADPPGIEWDRAVEHALTDPDTVMAIRAETVLEVERDRIMSVTRVAWIALSGFFYGSIAGAAIVYLSSR